MSHPKVWGYFDGWATAQGIDHESLPWHRWLNFVYYFLVRNMDAEAKEKFDNGMADAVSTWNYAQAKPIIESVRQAAKPATDGRKRRMPPRPSGWGDNEKATFDNKAAMKTLTAGGVGGKASRK